MIRYEFPNKVVLVTGSSRGIGGGVLSAFAQAGATCVLHFWDDPEGTNRKDANALTAQLGGLPGSPKIHVIGADVRDAGQIESLMKQVKETCGGLDVLVNNAGIIRDRTLRKMTLDEWHAVIQTNLDGVFHCCKYGIEILRDGGRVVNIASVAGLVGFHGQTNYAAAKAGVIGLTRVLAKELARRQITVNAIAPGVIQTPMLGEVKAEVMTEYLKQIPVGRLGTPADVANAVLFFASEESGYVTGQVLPVTGGWIRGNEVVKQLTIVVKPFRAEAVLRVIAELGVTACAVREAKGYGRQKGYLDRYRGSEYSTAYLPKVEITVWVTDEQAIKLREKLPKVARTGRIGDGKVFVVPLAWPGPLEF